MVLHSTLRITLLTAGLALAVLCHQSALGTATAPEKAPSAKPGKLYTVVDMNKVDPDTLIGWKVWRAQSCSRCHGAAQQGLVGPSLINSMKVLTKEQFVTTLKKGRIEKGMPNFGGVPFVADHLDELYAYLKGRSEGDIAAGRLTAITK